MIHKEEQGILARLQYDLPLHERLFAVVAEELAIPERKLLKTICSLKERNIIRSIAAIFNPSSLGYHTSLNAFRVAPSRHARSISLINAHRGVSHHYLREHSYQFWFTLSLPSGRSLDDEVAVLAREAEADDYIVLPAKKMLKARVLLSMDGMDHKRDREDQSLPQSVPQVRLTTREKEAVSLLLNDLPLTPNPFKDLCEKVPGSLSEKALIQIARNFKQKNIIKRYSAVLRHYNTSFTCNALTAWRPDLSDLSRVRRSFDIGNRVSHLYIRQTVPGKWEYPLFAMIHARNREELAAAIAAMEHNSGCHDYLVLPTMKELKKERVRYCFQ